MTNKLELKVGGQYKTRGGWRCVVVRDFTGSGTFWLWHSKDHVTRDHNKNGIFVNQDCIIAQKNNDFDIIEEWSESREFEVLLNVYRHINGDLDYTINKDIKHGLYDYKVIARKKITIKEGEFDD